MSAPAPSLESQIIRSASWSAPFLMAGELFFTRITQSVLMLAMLDPDDPTGGLL